MLLGLSAAAESARETETPSRSRSWSGAAVPLALGLVGYRLVGRSAVNLARSPPARFQRGAVAARAMGSDAIDLGLLAQPAAVGHHRLRRCWAVGFFGVALQRGKVTVVAAVTFVIEVIVPSALGLLVFGDSILPGRQLLAVAGFVLATGAERVALSRFAE